ncbi:MAG: hypothetical protein H6506_00465 [Calditrichaeota bacterium]|nr:hypothetical protein [Calditrichota bacterium]MCB9391109.1 hypothetical protein [Calditrichota bacterium]
MSHNQPSEDYAQRIFAAAPAAGAPPPRRCGSPDPQWQRLEFGICKLDFSLAPAEKYANYLKEAGFTNIRTEYKQMQPVSAVCVMGERGKV